MAYQKEQLDKKSKKPVLPQPSESKNCATCALRPLEFVRRRIIQIRHLQHNLAVEVPEVFARAELRPPAVSAGLAAECVREGLRNGPRVSSIGKSSIFQQIFTIFWRARSRLYQNESLQVDMCLTAFFKLYKMCTLLDRR